MTELETTEFSQLEHFPVSFFAMVMGLSGLTLAWHKGGEALGMGDEISLVLGFVALFAFIALMAIYTAKALRYPNAIKDELKHPIKLSFFPAISISLILLSACFLPAVPSFAHGVWLVGIILHLSLMLFVLNSWINHGHFKIAHINPSWFIPAVGNVMVPISGVTFGYTEISWFYFSVGMIFWIILLVIVFNRILFHDPLPVRLLPTMFILIAPPAIGFVSWVKLVGDVDSFARILYYIGLFFTLFLLTQALRFFKLPFFLSWWAYSFPLAAMTIATFVMHEKTAIAGFYALALALLGLLTAVIAVLVYKTFKAILGKQICLPE